MAESVSLLHSGIHKQENQERLRLDDFRGWVGAERFLNPTSDSDELQLGQLMGRSDNTKTPMPQLKIGESLQKKSSITRVRVALMAESVSSLHSFRPAESSLYQVSFQE